MAKRKRKGGRRGMFSRLGRKVGSFAGTLVQLFGVSHGLITGVSGSISDPANIPRAVVHSYTGYDLTSGSWDQNQAIKSATIIGVTFGVGWLIKQVARRM